MANVAEELKYEMLPKDQWEKLIPIFEEQGWYLPHPALAEAAVAYDENGNIVGVLPLQLVAHAEPGWVGEQWRGKVDMLNLVEKLRDWVRANIGENPLIGKGFVIVATNPAVERIARLAGLTEVEGKVFKGEFPNG